MEKEKMQAVITGVIVKTKHQAVVERPYCIKYSTALLQIYNKKKKPPTKNLLFAASFE